MQRTPEDARTPYVVVWDGVLPGPDGSKGSLLPGYPSQSSWVLVERAFRERLEYKVPRRMVDDGDPESA